MCVRKPFTICKTSNPSLLSISREKEYARIGTNKSTMKIHAFYKHQLILDTRKPGSLSVVLQRTDGRERSQSLTQKCRLLYSSESLRICRNSTGYG